MDVDVVVPIAVTELATMVAEGEVELSFSGLGLLGRGEGEQRDCDSGDGESGFEVFHDGVLRSSFSVSGLRIGSAWGLFRSDGVTKGVGGLAKIFQSVIFYCDRSWISQKSRIALKELLQFGNTRTQWKKSNSGSLFS
jgi:hypothetical protein